MTKESAGSQYHESLAIELASVLEKALEVRKNQNGVFSPEANDLV